ncbi:phospholipase D-like domain-containing protein [Bdellovibrio svalbardensis]|uniref:PLD phosphodiesterase domain-containing protein n=1 Tax=Bdellovibrio svalbardensis TaxID=2972972 RepID=A0ABT6DIT6_9BACT|nr:hypothetical protein [Bdellovibrio svalbardensis]MDG0815839.1 hypothetical protein [Bdellovibrio svalbardensis]
MIRKLLFFIFVSVSLQGVQVWADSYEYSRIFDVTFKVMIQKDLYKALNESISVQKSNLTQSQIVYLLQKNPQYMPLLEEALQKLTELQTQTPEAYTEYFAKVKSRLKEEVQAPSFTEQLQKHANPGEPVVLSLEKEAPGYKALKLYINHPHLKNATDPNSKVLPGDDLRQLVLDFIKGSEQELWYNVFDFDLKVIAEALKEQHRSKKVKILGGIDAGTISTRPEVKAIFDDLTAFENDNFKTVAVRSVGLNHQKIIVRDPFGPKAAVLFLSGNFTQSCIGPEGDLAKVPAAERPEISIPNANHALLVMGALPAQITRSELKKTLEFKIRGQSQYPVSGSYKVFGAKKSPKEEAPFIIISFSPNGGEGDVNKSIFVPLIEKSHGPIEAVHFAFSSKAIQDALVKKAETESKESGHFQFKSVGDTPFAMREWSVFLNLSGLKKDLTSNKYSSDAEAPILKAVGDQGLQDLQKNIHVAPAVYGDRSVRLADGTAAKVTSKIHHKVFIFPEDETAVLGTSFNPSENAENNNEQIIIVKDSAIVSEARGLFAYLYKNGAGSVLEEANKRNLRAVPVNEEPASPSERDE